MRGPAASRALRAVAASASLLVLAIVTSGCFFRASPTPSASTAPSGSGAPSASVQVSAPPSAAASASAAPQALVPGVYARVKVDGLRIRVAAKADATAVGALFLSDVVRIKADAGVAGGFHWYEVETIQTYNDQHLTGFIAGAKGDEPYLEVLAGTPAPTPTRSATPSLAASAPPSAKPSS